MKLRPTSLTPLERAAAEQAAAALRPLVETLPRSSPLHGLLHGTLCQAERALGREVSVLTRSERRVRRQ